MRYKTRPSRPPVWWYVAMTLLAVLAILSVVGCSPKTITEVQYRDRIEYRGKVKQLRDTIFVRDSVALIERHDTVFLTRWRTEYREHLRTDTLTNIVYVRDSVRVEVPLYIQHQPTRWECFKERMGVAFLWQWILLIIALVIYWRARR